MQTILLVEDDIWIQDMVMRRLSLQGYQVCVVGNAHMALAHVRADPPDLILMDVELPGMTGLQVTRYLKSHPTTKRIPIILLTAFAEEEDRQNGFKAGCDEYETKPIDFDLLFKKIRRCIG